MERRAYLGRMIQGYGFREKDFHLIIIFDPQQREDNTIDTGYSRSRILFAPDIYSRKTWGPRSATHKVELSYGRLNHSGIPIGPVKMVTDSFRTSSTAQITFWSGRRGAPSFLRRLWGPAPSLSIAEPQTRRKPFGRNLSIQAASLRDKPSSFSTEEWESKRKQKTRASQTFRAGHPQAPTLQRSFELAQSCDGNNFQNKEKCWRCRGTMRYELPFVKEQGGDAWTGVDNENGTYPPTKVGRCADVGVVHSQ